MPNTHFVPHNSLKSNDIHLEVCPTSNVQTNVIDKIENHPIDKIYNYGVSMSVNTDARTISNVSLTTEYNLLNNVQLFFKKHFLANQGKFFFEAKA